MQSILANSITLLAQAQEHSPTLVDREKLREISQLHNQGVRYELPWELLLVGLGLVITVITIVSLYRWWNKRQDNPSAMVLFSAIARKAGLGWRDRMMLWRIARANKLPSPIALLLARGALRHYVRVYAQHRSNRARNSLDRRITRIEAELFG